MQGMDPGERQDVMGDRQDGAGMVTAGAAGGDGDWDAAPKEHKRCWGQAPPGIQGIR